MAQPEYFNLNWRNTVSSTALIKRIDDFLNTLDDHDQLNAHLVNSTAKSLVKRDVSGFQNDMILQKVVKSVKKYRQGRDEHASRTDKYLARMIIVAELIMKMIDAGTPCTKREMWYKVNHGDFTEAQIDQICKDLALSIKVHPCTLGIVPEQIQSFVHVPQGCSLEVQTVNDIFRFTTRHRFQKKTLHGGERWSIARMYNSVQVVERETKVRAVVVSEHRSIGSKVEHHLGQPGFDGIIIVALGGFPDAASREFLHLLASELGQDVPFVWMSDCDPHSLTMYSVLKFGSTHQAYASPSMVCPRLIFGGMTMENFEAFHRGFPARFVATQLQKNPNLSSADQATLRRYQEREVEKYLKHVRLLPSCRPNQGSKQRIQGLRNGKTLELASESNALAQLDRFANNGTMPSFLLLEKFGQEGVAFFIAEQVAALRGEQYQHPIPFGQWSQTREAWIATSQESASHVQHTAEPIGEIDTAMMGV